MGVCVAVAVRVGGAVGVEVAVGPAGVSVGVGVGGVNGTVEATQTGSAVSLLAVVPSVRWRLLPDESKAV